MPDLNIRNAPQELMTTLRIESLRRGVHMRELVIETLEKAYPSAKTTDGLLKSLATGLKAATARQKSGRTVEYGS